MNTGWLIPDRDSGLSHPELLQHLEKLIQECPQPKPLGYDRDHEGGAWFTPEGAEHKLWMPDGAHYDDAQVDRFVDFCGQYLTFERGPLENQPIVFDTWQIDMIVRPIFGLYWSYNNLPVHNRVFFLAGRGSAKTLTVSCLCLFTLLARGYAKPEVDLYSMSKEQALFGFISAQRWIGDNAALASVLDVMSAPKMIRNLHNQGTMMVRTGEASREQGRGATLACIDDMLSQKNRKLFDVVTTGMGKATGSLLMLMTTPDPNIVATTTAKHEYDTAVSIAYERGSRPYYLPVIFEPDKSLDDGDIRAWVQASPGLKAGWVGLQSLLAEWRDAERSPGSLNAFKAYRLCRWGDGGTAALTAGWDQCLAETWLTEEIIERSKLYVGFDASSTRDLTCVVYLLCDDETQRWYVESRYWCARHTWDDILDWTDQEASIWLQRGSKVTLVDYNQEDNTVWIDSHAVVKSVEADLMKFGWPHKDILGMAMDSHRVHDYVRMVAKYLEEEMKLISVSAKALEPALDRMLQMIGDERIQHRGCHLDRWQMLNATVIQKGQYRQVEQPRASDNTRRKIDFISALLAAIDRRLAWERSLPEYDLRVFGGGAGSVTDPPLPEPPDYTEGLEAF